MRAETLGAGWFYRGWRRFTRMNGKDFSSYPRLSAQSAVKLLMLGASLLLLCGCETFNRSLFRGTPETIPGQTNVIVVIQPNGTMVTNVVSTPTIVVTNWVPRPEVFDTINDIGSLVPGYGTIITGVIGLAGTLYAAWLNRRNKKVAVATIEGVDQFRTALQASGEKGQDLDEKLKSILQKAHTDAGVQTVVAKMTDVHTGRIKPEDGAELNEEVRKMM